MPIRLKESIARSREVVRDDRIVEGRSEFLAPADRDLLRAIWLDGQPTQRMALLAGSTPRRVRYRVRQLIRHIHSESFLAAARALPRLRGRHAELARRHFCEGLSERATARAMVLSYHDVRQLLAELRVLIYPYRHARRPWTGLRQRHRRGA